MKKWFRKHENNKELGRPTFKEVEKDWKENKESFMYPNVKALLLNIIGILFLQNCHIPVR